MDQKLVQAIEIARQDITSAFGALDLRSVDFQLTALQHAIDLDIGKKETIRSRMDDLLDRRLRLTRETCKKARQKTGT